MTSRDQDLYSPSYTSGCHRMYARKHARKLAGTISDSKHIVLIERVKV